MFTGYDGTAQERRTTGLSTFYSFVALDEWLNAAAQSDMEPFFKIFLTTSFASGNKVQMPSLE